MTDDAERVGAFCARLIGGCEWGPHTAVGLERAGALVAGAVYCSFNGQNVCAHVAVRSGARLTRAFLHAIFYYPFVTLGARRITAEVTAHNVAAVRFVEKLGFVREATLRGASLGGGDVLLLVLWRDECRWLRGR